jgi:hypothetical protein
MPRTTRKHSRHEQRRVHEVHGVQEPTQHQRQAQGEEPARDGQSQRPATDEIEVEFEAGEKKQQCQAELPQEVHHALGSDEM